jgi:mersacidin/lichenicidin family type 2 lantibiotic
MKINTIRAWKDSSYRASLSEAEQAQLPENPVGQIELTDEELKAVCGAQAMTGGGVGSSIGIGGCSTSQQGVCQSVGGGSQCASQQGFCQSQGGNCPSQGGSCQSTQGRCPSQAAIGCNRTMATAGIC